MKTKKQTENRIHKYLQGELTGATLKAFEDDLKKDKDLRKEVEYHLALKEAAGYLSVQNFRETIKTIAANYRNEITSKLKNSPKKPGKEDPSETMADS
jgi:hypothetical protein